MHGKWIENLTWPEVETELQASPIIVIPVGARCKEHGLHLPINNDFTLAEYFTNRIIARCPVLALPTVPYGYYPAFAEYPGSVNLQKEVFRDTIRDICLSFARHGAKRFYVLNTGISTNTPLKEVQPLLQEQGIQMLFTNMHEAGKEARTQACTQSAGTHADEIETSMMLYIAPQTVKLHLAKPDIHPDRGPGGLTRNPDAQTGLYSPTGAWGDPTRATLEKGRLVVEAIVEHILKEITDLKASL